MWCDLLQPRSRCGFLVTIFNCSDQVRAVPTAALDFSLKADPSRLDDGTEYARCLFSQSVLWFYLVLELAVFGVGISR